MKLLTVTIELQLDWLSLTQCKFLKRIQFQTNVYNFRRNACRLSLHAILRLNTTAKVIKINIHVQNHLQEFSYPMHKQAPRFVRKNCQEMNE